MAHEIDLKTNPASAPEVDFSIPGEVHTPDPALPPAGYQRNEELARRTDNLAQQAEQQATEREQYAIPPDHDALRPDRNREIQGHIHKNHLDIGLGHPLYVTKWVNYVNQSGTMVWQAKSDGWRTATAQDFPEALEMGAVKEDNTIRIADVILMCITKDKHLMLVERDKQKRLRQQYGVEAQIHDLAYRTNRREGREVFRNVETPSITGEMSDRNQSFIKGRAAQKTAARALGNQMKQGPIPGVPIR